MARKAREKSKTGVYAVSLRGTTEIFRKQAIKDIFVQACEKYLGDGLKAIKFGRDKVEMLIRESEQGISLDMKPLITSFARAYNRETEITGKVFADRFKSIPMDDDEMIKDVEAYLNGEKNSSDVFKPKRARSSEKSAGTEKKQKPKAKPEKKAEPKESNVAKEEIKKPAEEMPKTAENIKEPEKNEESEKPKQRRNSSLPTWLL